MFPGGLKLLKSSALVAKVKTESGHRQVSILEAFSLIENHRSCQLWRLLPLSSVRKGSGQALSEALFSAQIYKLAYLHSVLSSTELCATMQM